jgi:hypothetical protein
MRAAVAVATEIVREIEVRFQKGDAAHHALRRLHAIVPTLMGYAQLEGNIPADLREEMARLLDRIRAALATGSEWLARTEPELIAQQVRLRLRRTYGMR